MKIKVILIAAMVTFAVVCAPAQEEAENPDKGPRRPMTVGHRGAVSLADENTLKSFSIAAEHGIDYFECDPRMTKDGEIVLMHDETVDRTTDGSGRVDEMTLEEIKELRTENGEEVPTLSEALELAKEKGIGVYLDNKMEDPDCMMKVVELVKEAGMEENVIMGLFWINPVIWLKKNHPEIVVSLSWPVPVPSLKQMRKIGADWAGMLVDSATPDQIKKCHKYGLRVITMPINDEELIREKIEQGLDVVQTDDVALVEKIMNEMFGDPEGEETGEE